MSAQAILSLNGRTAQPATARGDQSETKAVATTSYVKATATVQSLTAQTTRAGSGTSVPATAVVINRTVVTSLGK